MFYNSLVVVLFSNIFLSVYTWQSKSARILHVMTSFFCVNVLFLYLGFRRLQGSWKTLYH